MCAYLWWNATVEEIKNQKVFIKLFAMDVKVKLAQYKMKLLIYLSRLRYIWLKFVFFLRQNISKFLIDFVLNVTDILPRSERNINFLIFWFLNVGRKILHNLSGSFSVGFLEIKKNATHFGQLITFGFTNSAWTGFHLILKIHTYLAFLIKEGDIGGGSWWNISKTYEKGLLGNFPKNSKNGR